MGCAIKLQVYSNMRLSVLWKVDSFMGVACRPILLTDRHSRRWRGNTLRLACCLLVDLSALVLTYTRITRLVAVWHVWLHLLERGQFKPPVTMNLHPYLRRPLRRWSPMVPKFLL